MIYLFPFSVWFFFIFSLNGYLQMSCPLFSASGPTFLEALLLTSSSWLSPFRAFSVTILRSKTSFISCCSCCSFFIFSMSALKTYSSTMRFLIVSKASVGEIMSLFCPSSSGCLCSGFPSSLIYASSWAAMINTKHKRVFCL
jgi:hypothetical protein